ncbi:MAG: oligosaccharide flippase family protein [Bacteroidales bacterium]|nr:oligosaccharide flippase family protein [Bacteroidales bacterium]
MGNFIEMLRFGITRTAVIRFLSGSSDEDRKRLKGSNWLIGLIATSIIAAIIILAYAIFPETIDESGYSLFFTWYPLLAFANMPFQNAISVMHADQRFDRILFLQSVARGGFVVFLAINLFFFNVDITTIVLFHLGFHALGSIYSIIMKWDGIHYLFKATKKTNSTIFNFGKFSTGTLIGSNLLKSADTIIIGMSTFLGPSGVAYYGVPLKLTELLEIPLRSFIATAFPKMSKASLNGKIDEMKNIFYTYSGAVTYLFIPISLICFIFAEFLVLIIGGEKYLESSDIFRVFAVYGLFIAIDRFTGVALDSINQPKKNFLKVIYMVTANIIGDLVAVFGLVYFFSDISQRSVLMAVSLVTILMTVIGLIAGYYYLNKAINISLKRIFYEGYVFYREGWKRLRRNR